MRKATDNRTRTKDGFRFILSSTGSILGLLPQSE
jgi:hypothetical protein